eukprot:Gb_08947 [translate_table: standard]
MKYLDVWELAVAANRRNTDDHIVLLGWMLENGKKEALSLEIVSDKWLPRIELQENGDENLMVGIAMDQTSVDLQIRIPTDDGGLKELPPCPVLLCMTIEGKLNLFSFARIAEVWHVPELVVSPLNIPIPHSKTMVGTSNELRKSVVGHKAALHDSEVEKSSPATWESKAMVSKEAVVNTKTLQASKQESKVVKGEDLNTSFLQKSTDEKPISITPVIKEADENTKTCQDTEQENEMGKAEDIKKFQLQKTGDLLKPVPNETPSSITLGMKEAEKNAKMFQVGNQNLEIAKVENVNKFQLHKASDVVKPMPDENPATMKNQKQASQDIRKPTGIFSSGPSIVSQFPPKSSPFECSSSPFASSCATVKGASQPGAFQKVGSISMQANVSETSISGMGPLSSQNVTSKANLFGPSEKELAGKGSMRKNMLDNEPSAGFGSLSFGHLSNSSISYFKSPSVSSSTSGGFVPIEGKKEDKSVAGAFGSHKVPGTSVSSSTPDLQLMGRTSGISDTEADFSRELEKVRSMANEVDELMLNIEGGKMMSKGGNISFRKQTVMSIEDGIKKLAETCKGFKEKLEEQLLDIQNLRDKTMQVVAWRIYMQSIVTQAADSQYQDLRSRQKLNPELEIKRQCIMKADQRLKHQILELEGHLQNLEINNFEEGNNSSKRGHQKQLQTARQLQSLQSFYNTVNSQLAVAEQLAECLSLQMEALNISSTPENLGKSRSTKKESLFKSIGLSPDDSCFESPRVKEKSLSPYSFQKVAYSPSSSFSTSMETPIRKPPGAFSLQEPETARRRRDPIDNAWANVGSTKTTVKRFPQATSRASKSRSLLDPSESKISQLRASDGMFGHEDHVLPTYQSLHAIEGKSQAIEASKRNGQNVSSVADTQRNIAKVSAVTMPSETPPESFFKWSNSANTLSTRNMPTQAAPVYIKSSTTESSSLLPNAEVVEDKRLQKKNSDSKVSPATDFAQSKSRASSPCSTSPFGPTGTKSQGFSGFKPIAMQSSFASMTQASFDLGKPKASTGSVFQESMSKFETTTKTNPKPKQLLSTETKPGQGNIRIETPESNKLAPIPKLKEQLFAETKPVHVKFGKETPELNKAASMPVPSLNKSGQSSRTSSVLQESSPSTLAVSTSADKRSLFGGAPGHGLEVATASSSAVCPESHSGKPFSFSMDTSNVSAGQNVAVSSVSLSSSVEAKTVLNTLKAAPVTPFTGPEYGTIKASVSPLFDSKPANTLAAEASSQPNPFPSGMLSSSYGAQGTGVSFATSLTSTEVNSSPITQSNSPPALANEDHGVEARSASHVLSQSEVANASQIGSSPLATSSSSQIHSTSSAASFAEMSVSQVSPLVTTCPQPKPLFAGFSNVRAVSSATASSFPSSTVSGFGQFSAPASGSSGLGLSSLSTLSASQMSLSSSSASSAQIPVSQVSPLVSTSAQPNPLFAGFSTLPTGSSSSAFSFPSSAASGFGNLSAPVSGSSGIAGHSSVGPNISASFGFPSSSSMSESSQQTQASSSFGRIGMISPEPKTLSSSPLGSSMGIAPAVSNEEDMEEEATTQMADTNFGGFGGFGLGSATPTTPKSNPFGGPLVTGQSSPAFSLSVPAGELFRPASFSIPVAQSSPQSSPNLFGSSFVGAGGISPVPATASAFGQPAQPGPGQQALGSALGAFGQSRQLGIGSGFGAGFGSPSSFSGSGFAAAASGGGFAQAASGGGFAAAASGGGFAAAANAVGAGFAGAGAGGGFQSFSGNQGSSGFSAFGSGSPGLTNAPQNLFTQIRK